MDGSVRFLNPQIEVPVNRSVPTDGSTQIGVGVKGVFLRSHKQKILGFNTVAAYPERRVLRTQLSCVYANSSGRLSRMIGKPWLRVK